MKKYFLIILLLPIQVLWASGPDDMLLWRYEAPISLKGHFSQSTGQIYKRGFEAILLHTNPYRINSLSWDYGAFKYGFGRWGIIGGFRSYSLTNLYSDYRASLGMAVQTINDLGLSLNYIYGNEKFGENSSYSRFDIDLGLSYSRKNLSGEFALKRLNLKKPYDYPQRPEPQLIGAIDLGQGMIFTVGFKELYINRGRWFFRQDINIIDGANLQLGYMNNPNILQWGLDLSWKSLNFSFAYLAVSRLNDTMIMGLSWGA